MGEMYAANQDLLGRLDDRSDRYLLDVISVPGLDCHFAKYDPLMLSLFNSNASRCRPNLPATGMRSRYIDGVSVFMLATHPTSIYYNVSSGVRSDNSDL